MVKWIGRFSLSLQRLRDAWMDNLPMWLKKMLKDKQEVELFWIRTHQKTEKGGILHK